MFSTERMYPQAMSAFLLFLPFNNLTKYEEMSNMNGNHNENGKTKIHLGMGILAGVVLILILTALSVPLWDEFGNNDQISDENTIIATTATVSDTFSGNQQETEAVNRIGADVSLDILSTWKANGEYYVQYNVTIYNIADTDIKEWTLRIKNIPEAKIEQYWNCKAEVSGEDIVIIPVGYSVSIASGTSTLGIGFIAKSVTDYRLSKYTLKIERVGVMASEQGTTDDKNLLEIFFDKTQNDRITPPASSKK